MDTKLDIIKHLTHLPLLFLPLLLIAQTGYTQSGSSGVTGILQDETGEAIVGASVVVYEDESEADMVTGRSSDSNGEFDIEIEPGSYLLKITFISYEPYRTNLDIASGEIEDLGNVSLEISTSHLEEIAVEGERSRMEMNFDSRVFHVEEDITSMGGSALDVIDNVPSLSTDFEGNISLRGNQGVTVLINGRPSSLVRNGTDALSSIPANMIESVEIITNPSARYAAEGSGGIINIELKEGASLGLNGSVSANTGYPHDHEISGNFNYNVNNINWFLSSNLEYDSQPRSSQVFQQSASADPPIYEQFSSSDDSETEGRVRFGADIFLPADQLLTATGSFDAENGEGISDVQYIDYTMDRDIVQEINREDVEEQGENGYDFRLEYENRFDEEGDHRLTADVDFEFGSEQESSFLTQSQELGNSDLPNQRTDNQESYNDYRIQADYERPVMDNGRFEAGYRSTIDRFKNEFIVEEQEGETWETLPAYNDNFQFNESIHAGYAIFSGQADPFTYQLGLRLEQTNIYTELDLSGETSDQSYLNLFPSAFLTYRLGEGSSLQASYSRRLSRPRHWWLLPYSGYSDSRNISRGNPALEPEFSNSFEAGYLRHWDSGSVLSSAYYRHRTGVVEQIVTQGQNDNGDPITTRFPINLATEEAWGIEFTADQELFENLQLSGSLNLYSSESEGTYEGEELSNETQSFQSRLRVRWRFLEGWNFQSYSGYRGPRSTTQGRTAGSLYVGGGLAKELFDRAVTISLNVRDPFNSRNHNRIIDEPGFYSERFNTYSSRSVRLNIRYRFSQD
ncbi:MAG: TonB-dependent receptor [Balneolales bacterium]